MYSDKLSTNDNELINKAYKTHCTEHYKINQLIEKAEDKHTKQILKRIQTTLIKKEEYLN